MRVWTTLKRALKVGLDPILVRGDHVGETADGETVYSSVLRRWGLRSGKPKPVGHAASSSESACGAIIVEEAQVVDDVESHPWDETVLPVRRLPVLSVGLVDQHVLDRLKVLCGLVVEFVSHGILDRKEPLVLLPRHLGVSGKSWS
jgi:hypothetical protein